MRSAVGVQQSPDHFLVLCVSLFCFTLEEFNAGPTKGDRHLYCIVPKGKLIRRWKKVRDDLDCTYRFIGVFDFLAHRSVSPFSKILHRKFE